jgi:hypothetical protein
MDAPRLKFKHEGKDYEVRATLIGDKWIVRVFHAGEMVPGVAYSVSGRAKTAPPTILMRQAQSDVESGRAARFAKIGRSVENQMPTLMALTKSKKND